MRSNDRVLLVRGPARFGLCVAVAAALSACGDAGEASPGPYLGAVDSAVMGVVPDSSVPPGPGTAGGATLGGASPGGATTGGGSAGTGVAGVGGGTLGGAPAGGTAGAPPIDAGGGAAAGGGGSQDAAAPIDAAPPVVLELPTAAVDCGGSACDSLTKVCCEAWSLGTGFAGQPMCATRDACRQAYAFDIFNPDNNRLVTHTCDGAEDCAGGQICCFYMEGRPICDALDPAMCFANLTGPGAGRVCAEPDKCQQGAFEFVGEGIPLGVVSCNDDTDCQARPGTTCQPEPDSSLTSGKNIRARPYVKVCR